MIKKILLLFSLFLLVNSHISGQRTPRPENTIISLITCDPGIQLYGKFGHTAIRLQDTLQNIDWAFNYGVFDFNTPNFYTKFVRGETDYILGVYSFSDFLMEYQRDGIGVYEQVLDLNDKEKEILSLNLMQNALPEYRKYRYNFVFDNCATQPRDQIIKAMNRQLVFKNGGDKETFRFLIQSHLRSEPWASMGINLIFGMGADRSASNWESHFLPGMLMEQMAGAEIYDYKSNQKQKIVKSSKVLVLSSDKNQSAVVWYQQPTFWFILYFLFGIYSTFNKKRTSFSSKFFDSSWMVLAGITGLLIAYLMLFSEHPFVDRNLNILWLNPLYLIAVFFIWKKNRRKLNFYISISFVFLILLFIILIMLQKQTMPFDVLPLLAIILFRISRRAYRNGRKIFKKSTNAPSWKI